MMRPVGIALAVLAFGFAFRNVDLAKAASVLARVGLAAPLALVPVFCALGLDATAWRALLGLLGHDVSIARILRARFCAEAVALTVPGGPLAAESLKPKLLHDAAVPLRDGIATVAARKVAVLATNGAYVALALVLGRTWLPLPIGVGLGVMALGLFATSGGLWLGGRRLHAASSGCALLSRIPRLRAILAPFTLALADTDERVHFLFGAMRSRWIAIASPLAAAWMLEAVESWTVLRLVGVDAPFAFVLAMEVSVSLLRNIVVAVPAGLGIQDAGYAAWLGQLELADPSSVAAAFVLVKRAKDLVVVCVGYGLLALATPFTALHHPRARTRTGYRS